MNYTLLLVLQTAVLMGITSGILGCFVLLRQQSLLGDAVSHAALPGIIVMFLCTHTKNYWILLAGGMITGVLGVVCMHYLMMYTKLKKDSILGVILSVFFGLGLILMTIAQKVSVAHQALLNKFLFGNSAIVLMDDMYLITFISGGIITTLMIIWKECILYTFDPIFTHLMGFNVKIIEAVLTLLLVVTITIGLQTVGVILMSTMLIAPAAAARQWVHKILHMIVLAGFFGGSAAAVGVYASSCMDHLPTGPAIVIAASMIVFFSLIASPVRGAYD